MPVTHLVDKVACPRSVISAWSYAGHCSQETQSLSKVNLPTRKAAAETGCSKGTHGRNSKDPGVTEGISALAQDSAATPANCSVGSRGSLFNLEHRQGFEGKVFLQEKLWESPACKQKTRKILLSCSLDVNQSIPIFIYYQADYQWPLKNRSGVCLLLCQSSLGHCRSKDSKPRSFPAERLCYQREGLCPNTWNTVALPFLVQVVLCNQSQPRIPMNQSLELILNTCEGKGSSPFLQLIPMSSFSNILFLTQLKIKALPPRQPGHQNTPGSH